MLYSDAVKSFYNSAVDSSQQALYVKFNRDFIPFLRTKILSGRSSSQILGLLQGLGRHCLSVQSIDWPGCMVDITL